MLASVIMCTLKEVRYKSKDVVLNGCFIQATIDRQLSVNESCWMKRIAIIKTVSLVLTKRKLMGICGHLSEKGEKKTKHNF